MPTDYAATLEDLKKHVLAARLEAERKINNELLQLCWRIGRTILDRQKGLLPPESALHAGFR